jgi:predicted DNA binding CopG/RHH family protein
MNELNREEREILEAFEAGKLKPTKGAKALMAKHQAYAAAALRKDARINIRIPSRDLRALQKRALEEGMPYQTLIASILHKYVEGRLKDATDPPRSTAGP